MTIDQKTVGKLNAGLNDMLRTKLNDEAEAAKMRRTIDERSTAERMVNLASSFAHEGHDALGLGDNTYVFLGADNGGSPYGRNNALYLKMLGIGGAAGKPAPAGE